MGILINQGRQIGGLSEQDQANIGKVTQTETTTDAEYEILFSGTADNITRTEGTRKSEGMTYNANHKALTIGTRFSDSTIGDYSISTGSGNTASGEYSHAEGGGAMATGQYSHAEGGGTSASNFCAHAEGGGTTASGNSAHAEGGGTTASGDFSHVEGGGTVANHAYQHVFGMYNTPDPSANSADQKGTYIEIVGNGTINGSTLTTSNARTLDWQGNETLKGNLTVGGTSISVNNNLVAHSGNVETGDSNGKVKIAGTNVSVKGLGNAAYDNTVSIAHGGTGATTRLNAFKAITNQDVSSNATHFVTFTSNWATAGYSDVSSVKKVLNIVAGASGNWFNYRTPVISAAGVIEIGKYLDFHTANAQTNDYTFRFENTGNTTMTAYGTISQTSSRKIKENVKPLSDEEALKILELEPVSFDYIEKFGGDKDHRGFIAEEVDKILPNLTTPEDGDMDDMKHFSPMSLSYIEMIPYLVKVVQIQQEQINTLTEKLDNLNKN